jgi:hypothetical protein
MNSFFFVKIVHVKFKKLKELIISHPSAEPEKVVG